MNKTKIKSYVDTAKIWAKRSTCVRKQVGAVIFNMKTDRLLAIGYNGTAKGQIHCNELFEYHADMHRFCINSKLNKFLDNTEIDTDYSSLVYNNCAYSWHKVDEKKFKKLHHQFSDMYEVHAEQNAIFNLIKTGVSYTVDDLAIVTTLEPCFNCAKAIIALGIKHVFYIEKYDNAVNNVINYLEDCGVECEEVTL